MKKIRAALIGIILVLFASLVLARVHPLGKAGAFSGAFVSAAQSTTQGNAARGKALFQDQCSGCHSLDSNNEGPRLRGVYGRTSGSAPGYDYSPALKESHILWNETTLNQWLTDPDAFIPGNNMDFQVDSPRDRSDLIQYLRESPIP